MISTSEFFDTLTADTRRWPDHTDYYLHGPTRCTLHVPAVLAANAPRRIVRAIYPFQLLPCGSADVTLTPNPLPDVEGTNR